ncbi:HlyD family secretion protein [Aestuariicella hydrocarbonica]|uniref:HlyD family secretion protein n=2 Tax=Pseudomaricurvus hydrocarbonicus TaxID=1470433 RepID=A0A9E5MJP3_9GAMM|nr:HlyD family secretion protein [Aestuariicella hydrocarbonica]NHO65439.1 HlyD family secretion protein [Aestuariicella hydrocarbonica]
MLVVPVLLMAAGFAYFLSGQNYVSTDNAYVKQDMIAVGAEVGGRIVEVHVRENQPVAAGDLLFRIDPEPFELAVAEAEASLANARAKVEELEVEFATSSVDIESAEEDISYFEKEYHRQQELLKTRVSTEASVQAAEHALSEARSRLDRARAEAAKAKAALSTGGSASGVNPMILAAQVQLDKARLNLSRTEVRAPAAGIITQTGRLQVGQFLMQGLSAMNIVKADRSWVEANFKETDLENMRIGQPVTIELDTYPGVAFSGQVESIGAGTGSEFSVLPAQNANGNWVKITQRVSVRIAINDASSKLMITGLSAHVRINTRG